MTEKHHVEWSTTDEELCERGTPPCEACDRAEAVQVGYLLFTSRRVAEDTQTVLGSSWECPNNGRPYALVYIHCLEDIEVALIKDGFHSVEEVA